MWSQHIHSRGQKLKPKYVLPESPRKLVAREELDLGVDSHTSAPSARLGNAKGIRPAHCLLPAQRMPVETG